MFRGRPLTARWVLEARDLRANVLESMAFHSVNSSDRRSDVAYTDMSHLLRVERSESCVGTESRKI